MRISFLIQNDVVRWYIAVNDIFIMKISQCFKDTTNDKLYFIFFEFSFSPLYILSQCATRKIIKAHIHIQWIMKSISQIRNKLMFQLLYNIKIMDQLLYSSWINETNFWDLIEQTYIFVINILSFPDPSTKWALAQKIMKLKIRFADNFIIALLIKCSKIIINLQDILLALLKNVSHK